MYDMSESGLDDMFESFLELGSLICLSLFGCRIFDMFGSSLDERVLPYFSHFSITDF